jgi:nitroreductase
MLDSERLKKILNAACQAPSGGNSQPWHFELFDQGINVIAEPEKDNKILNYHNRGSWIANGAVIENIAIASTHLGYKTEIQLFPESKRPNLVATIKLRATAPQNEQLYESIFRRRTNRRAYEENSLLTTQKSAILKSSERFVGELRLIEDKENIKALADASSIGDLLMFENKELHNLFFQELIWTKKEENRKKAGLYIKTLEINRIQQATLKILGKWPLMRLFNKFGFARIGIARENAAKYARTAAIGAIITGDKDEDFVNAGRMVQRIWLTATSLNLNMHLITGILFIHQAVEAGSNHNIYSKSHIKLIKKTHEKISKVLNNPKGTITLLFRIGKDGDPSASSSKREPQVIIL